MQLLKLAKIALIMWAATNILGCKNEPYPEITPYQLTPNAQGQCPYYKLVDPVTLTFQFDAWKLCGTGGWALPPGQLEESLAWGRQEIQNCQQSQINSLTPTDSH